MMKKLAIIGLMVITMAGVTKITTAQEMPQTDKITIDRAKNGWVVKTYAEDWAPIGSYVAPDMPGVIDVLAKEFKLNLRSGTDTARD